MAKYRKKPVVIEATQWRKNGDHPDDDVFRKFEDSGSVPSAPREGAVVRYFSHPGVLGRMACEKCAAAMLAHGWIDTLESGHVVCPGDFIITGIQGERYPCKPDIFAATYELVMEPKAWGGDVTRDPGGQTWSMSAGAAWIDGRYVEIEARSGFRIDDLPEAVPEREPKVRGCDLTIRKGER